MQLSRLGQGLAASAVSALAITGLVVTAPAAVAAEDGGVRLLSQQDGIASVKSPVPGLPVAATLTLAAEQLDATATISFEYNADPAAGDAAAGWTAVAPMSSTTHGRYVAVEWSPDATLVGSTIALRAVATSPTATTYSTRNDVALSGDASSVNYVSLGSTGAFFAQPYADSGRTARLMAVTGSTSASDGTVELSAWNPAAGVFEGSTQAAVTFTPMKTPGSPFPFAMGHFGGALDISAFGADAGDALAVRAERDSDDVLPTTLEAQTITSISATAEPVAGPETTTVTVQVLDQHGRAVVGAEVRSSDGTLVGYTDHTGQVAADQPSGTTESYYANTTDASPYDDGVDVRTEPVQAPDYVPVPTATVAELADGTVFDDQEYADGDVALQVVDGRGEPFAAEEQLTYTLQEPGADPADPVTATTDEHGRLVVPFDPAGADGEYTLEFTAPGTAGGGQEEPVTFVAGDAELALTPLAGTGPSGGEIVYEGTLSVEGEPLVGRDIDLAYVRGPEQAPGSEADAALVIDGERMLTGDVATGAGGTFWVTVADLAETGGPAESGGLTVTARGLGDAIEASADFLALPPAPPTDPTQPPTQPPTQAPVPTQTPPPSTGKTVVELRLSGSNARGGADRLVVRGPASAAGQRVRVHVRTAGGFWRVVKGVHLDSAGDARVTVDDRNGRKVTRYRVRLLPNPTVKAFTSKVLRRR